MTAFLVDGNALIALTVVDHVHHEVAIGWFERTEPQLATCPLTEGTLLRFLVREEHRALDAAAVLDAMRTQEWHTFWPDELPYAGTHLAGVIGHRQIADAYLVALARHHGGRVATFDKGLSVLHGDAVELLAGCTGSWRMAGPTLRRPIGGDGGRRSPPGRPPSWPGSAPSAGDRRRAA